MQKGTLEKYYKTYAFFIAKILDGIVHKNNEYKGIGTKIKDTIVTIEGVNTLRKMILDPTHPIAYIITQLINRSQFRVRTTGGGSTVKDLIVFNIDRLQRIFDSNPEIKEIFETLIRMEAQRGGSLSTSPPIVHTSKFLKSVRVLINRFLRTDFNSEETKRAQDAIRETIQKYKIEPEIKEGEGIELSEEAKSYIEALKSSLFALLGSIPIVEENPQGRQEIKLKEKTKEKPERVGEPIPQPTATVEPPASEVGSSSSVFTPEPIGENAGKVPENIPQVEAPMVERIEEPPARIQQIPTPNFSYPEMEDISNVMEENKVPPLYSNFIYNFISGQEIEYPSIITNFNTPRMILGLIGVLNLLSNHNNKRYGDRLSDFASVVRLVQTQMSRGATSEETKSRIGGAVEALRQAQEPLERQATDEQQTDALEEIKAVNEQLRLQRGSPMQGGAGGAPPPRPPTSGVQILDEEKAGFNWREWMYNLLSNFFHNSMLNLASIGSVYAVYPTETPPTVTPIAPISTVPPTTQKPPISQPQPTSGIQRQPQPNNLSGKTIVPSVYILDPKDQQQQNNLWNAFNFVPRYTEGDGFTPSENQLKAYHMLSEKLRYENSGINLDSEWGQPKNTLKEFKSIYDLGYQRPINQNVLPKLNMDVSQSEVINGTGGDPEINPMYKNPKIGENLLEHGKKLNIDMQLNMAYNNMSNVYATDANDRSIDNSMLFGLVP